MTLFNLFRKRNYNLKNEILSGITVALALIPEAVPFFFVAGVPPLSGLFTVVLVA